MVAIKLPDSMSGSRTFENILSIRVLEWLVILVGCKIKGINGLEARESKYSFAWSCSLWFNRLTLNYPSRKIDSCSFEIFSNSLFK